MIYVAFVIDVFCSQNCGLAGLKVNDNRVCFGWVDWFNSERLLEAIGYITPDEAEEKYYANLKTLEGSRSMIFKPAFIIDTEYPGARLRIS